MKRLISLLCILTLILGLCTFSYAEEDAYIYDSVHEELLSELGFITPVISDSMTRYELSEILVKMLSYNTGLCGEENPFSDINPQSSQFPVMKSAYNLEILSGGGARPNDSVSYNEAVKMVVSAIGYGNYANYKGGYPTGYVKMAGELKLLDGVEAGDRISRDSLYALLYNSMHADILLADNVGEDVGYTEIPGRNILTYYHKLTIGEGIVQGVKGLSMIPDYDIPDSMVYIDGKLLNDTTKNSHTLVGQNTKYYYDAEKMILKAVIAYNSERITLDAGKAYDYSDKTLSFDENGKITKYKLEGSTKIIYNGELIDSFSKDLLLDVNGEITLIKNSLSATVDVIIVKNIEVMVVGSIDYARSVFYDYYDKTPLTLDMDDPDYSILFKDELGNDMEVKELVRGDVISYSKSSNGKIIEAYYSNTEIIGAIEQSGTDEEGTLTLTIDGESYRASDNFAQFEAVNIGDSGAFRLSTDKRVAYVSYDATAKYGYLVAGMQMPGMDGAYRLKIFSIDGEMKEFTLPKRIELDGTRVDARDAYAALVDGSDMIIRQLIRFEQNSKGELIMIDTATKGSGESTNSLHLGFSAYVDKDGNARQSEMPLTWRDSGVFGGKVPVNQAGPILVVPIDPNADDENYIVSTPYRYFTHDHSYAVETYKTDRKELMSEIVLYKSDTASVAIEVARGLAVVNNVSKVSKDGEAYTKLSLLFDGAETEYLVKDEKVLSVKLRDEDPSYHSFGCGDVIRYSANDIGYITSIELYYDRANDRFKYTANENTSTLLSGFRIACGEVYAQVSGIILFHKGVIPNGTSGLSYEDLECYKSDRYKIYTYDSEERVNKLRLGSIADISDYATSGKGSKMIVQSRNGFDGTIIIYK